MKVIWLEEWSNLQRDESVMSLLSLSSFSPLSKISRTLAGIFCVFEWNEILWLTINKGSWVQNNLDLTWMLVRIQNLLKLDFAKPALFSMSAFTCFFFYETWRWLRIAKHPEICWLSREFLSLQNRRDVGDVQRLVHQNRCCRDVVGGLHHSLDSKYSLPCFWGPHREVIPIAQQTPIPPIPLAQRSLDSWLLRNRFHSCFQWNVFIPVGNGCDAAGEVVPEVGGPSEALVERWVSSHHHLLGRHVLCFLHRPSRHRHRQVAVSFTPSPSAGENSCGFFIFTSDMALKLQKTNEIWMKWQRLSVHLQGTFFFGNVVLFVCQLRVWYFFCSDWINWDTLNDPFVATNEASRSFLASFILVMDLLIVMQVFTEAAITTKIEHSDPGFSHVGVASWEVLRPRF